MKKNKLKVMSSIYMLLRDRERSVDKEDIKANLEHFIRTLYECSTKIDEGLLMYLYSYLYTTAEFAEGQYIKYNDMSKSFTIFTAYPLKDGIPSYDYVKISTSKDPTIPINKEEIHIELEDDYENFSVQRNVSMLLPEDIELVRLESEKKTMSPTSMKRLVAIGRKLPPKTVLYRNISDLSLITAATTETPFQKATGLFIQDPTEIERIKPTIEVSVDAVKAATDEYWEDAPARLAEKDISYYTERFIDRMCDYQAERRHLNIRRKDNNYEDDSDNVIKKNPYTGLRKGELDDAVIDFIDQFRKKGDMGGRETDYGFAYEYEENPEHKTGHK